MQNESAKQRFQMFSHMKELMVKMIMDNLLLQKQVEGFNVKEHRKYTLVMQKLTIKQERVQFEKRDPHHSLLNNLLNFSQISGRRTF
jgi:hypothetical protein